MRRVLAGILLLAACHKDEPQPREKPPKSDPGASQPEPVKAEDPCAKLTPETEGRLAWVHDDYKGALACATASKKPLVIDFWAPWCHTCLSMQSTVFLDPSFAADANKYVFLALDTDREVNAPAVEKFALSAWPTFYVIDAKEAVLSRFVGSASLEQFHAFLDASQKPDQHLQAAERASAVKDHATAAKELEAALAGAPKDWVRRPDALGSLILAKLKLEDWDGCMDVAEKHMGERGNAAVASDILVTAMACAEHQEKAEAPRVAALRKTAIEAWQALLADKTAPLSVDDRSDAMASLRETLDQIGKHDDAVKTAEAQRALLDDAATKAPNPTAAMTYNWHRAEVYTYLGKGLDVVPALEKSAADLPNEYDPRARLGWVYLKAKKYPEAAKWLDDALKLVYGPRKARVLGYRAEVAHEMGDAATEKKVRGEIVALWESLPDGQKDAKALAAAKKALDDLSAGSAARR